MKHEWRAVIGGTGYIESDRHEEGCHGYAFLAGFAPCAFCGKHVPRLRDPYLDEECPQRPDSSAHGEAR